MISYRKDKIIASLINAGADINAESNEGKTARMYAKQARYQDVVRTFDEYFNLEITKDVVTTSAAS